MSQMLYLPATEESTEAVRAGRFGWFRNRPFLFLVVVPTLVAAIYLFLIASSQYQSEAQFIVRGLEAAPERGNGVSQLLGVTGTLSPGQQEAQSIREYLRSHDAIPALRARKIDLVAMYRRDGVDLFSRLWFAEPRAETLLEYYRDHVDILYDPDDNITRVSVRAFRPEDAQRTARALLAMGEDRVNAFNDRLFDASLKAATADVTKAEQELASIQGRLGGFRETNRDIDPTNSGQGGQRQLTDQQAALDQQVAVLADMRRQLSPASPQVRAMEGRVSAMATAVAAARGRLTGGPQAVSNRLGAFEDLRFQQDFAAKRYETARARLEEAKERATKERLFIVPVVEPNLPEKPALPKPFRTTLLIFIGLCIAYGIGWMLLAGVREHQA